MNSEEKEAIYEVWAPPASLWSPWVKPVLFSFLDYPTGDVPAPDPINEAWIPAAGPVAVILDLPGATGVAAGLTLARRAWRPVPLYNAIPAPAPIPAAPYFVQVDVLPIIAALRSGAAALSACALAATAPPAFLLDANRRGIWVTDSVKNFDNRSVSFPTDFPSATRLLSQGIRRALLVQAEGREPQPDLAHTLRRWAEAGIELSLQRLDSSEGPEPLAVGRPSLFRALWHRLLTRFAFRANVLGGYGGEIEESGSAG